MVYQLLAFDGNTSLKCANIKNKPIVITNMVRNGRVD